jgi:hypothetical protein
VSARGIEAYPEKIQAILTMKKPTKLKEVQQLTGRVAALSRFVTRLGEKALPFCAIIKQGENFEWNEEADKSFEHFVTVQGNTHIIIACSFLLCIIMTLCIISSMFYKIKLFL